MRKWYSLRKYSLILLSKTNVSQNLKGGETRKAITSEGIRLMAISSSYVIASAPARLLHHYFLDKAKTTPAQTSSCPFARQMSTGSEEGLS